MNRRFFLIGSLLAAVAAGAPPASAAPRPQTIRFTLREGELRGLQMNAVRVGQTTKYVVASKLNKGLFGASGIITAASSTDLVGTFTGRIGSVRGAARGSVFIPRTRLTEVAVVGQNSERLAFLAQGYSLVITGHTVAVKGIRARNFDAADELEEGVKVLQALRAVVESTTTIDEEVKAELLRLTMAAIERSNEGIIAGRNGSGPGLEAAARDAITLSRQAFSLSLNTVVE